MKKKEHIRKIEHPVKLKAPQTTSLKDLIKRQKELLKK